MSRLLRGTLVAVLILLLASCGKDEGFTTFTIPSSFLRLVNTVPDSPQLNLLVNDRLVQNLNFGQASIFLEVLPDIALRFSARYVTGGDVLTLIPNTSVRIDLNHDYTILLAGTLNSPQLIQIDNPPVSETATAGQLELQFTNAASNVSGPVAITLRTGGNVVQDIALNFLDVTDRIKVAPDDYDITVTDSSTNEVLWFSGDFSLSSGTRGLIVLIDYFGPSASGVRMISVGEQLAIPFENEQLPAALRVANMTPDQGPLDVYFNDTLFQSNVGFTEVTGYTVVDAGSVTAKVRPFGQPLVLLSETQGLQITPGTFHTLAITGIEDSNNVQLYQDDNRRVRTRSFLSVINAAPSFIGFDVYVVEPGVSVNDSNPVIGSLSELPSISSSSRLGLNPGSYDFIVTEQSTKTILLGPLRIDLAGGGLYSVLLTDSAGGGEPLDLVLGDDFN